VNSGGGHGGVGGLGGWSEWSVHVAALGGQGIEWRPSLQRLLELWLEDGLAQGGRRRTSDAVASGLGKAMMVSHRRQVQQWQRRMVRRAGVRWELKEKKRGSSSVGRSSYSCTRRWPRAAETVGGNDGRNGSEAMGGQGSSRSPNAVGMAAPLFGPCG
jgi:hypothetical protein